MSKSSMQAELKHVPNPSLQPPRATERKRSTKWIVAALLLLSAIPLAAGAFRLSQLAGGAEITPDNARFFASPIPVVLHIVSVTLYALLGAFQFVPSLRRRRHRWHRIAGWIVLPSGLLVALMLGGIALLAVFGIRYPVKMLPLLLFELLWKVIGVLAFGPPTGLPGNEPQTHKQYSSITSGVLCWFHSPFRGATSSNSISKRLEIRGGSRCP